MNDMTYEEVRNNFIQDLAENAYLSMCSMEEMKIVIEALDKQIPKKPVTEKDKVIFDIVCGRCPECDSAVYSTTNLYCHKCGQALDWSAIE